MSHVKQYERPVSVEEALALLEKPGAVILAGGTRLVPDIGQYETVVDLQAAGLEGISASGETVTAGGMTRLQRLVDHVAIPPLLRLAAHREGPNTFRHAGTIGGTVVAADPESELYAALLVHEAQVTVRTRTGEEILPLDRFDLPAGGLITAVTVKTGGQAAAERVARTPADRPIVAALARRAPDGRLYLALCGVAGRPVLVDPGALDTLDPPADFRGSTLYRREMAAVLANRVLEQLTASS